MIRLQLITPPLRQRRKNPIYEESDNESSDGIVPPTVN